MGGVVVEVEAETRQERRDLDARAKRDHLADLLSIRPGDLRTISKVTAEAMIAMIERQDRGDSN